MHEERKLYPCQRYFLEHRTEVKPRELPEDEAPFTPYDIHYCPIMNLALNLLRCPSNFVIYPVDPKVVDRERLQYLLEVCEHQCSWNTEGQKELPC